MAHAVEALADFKGIISQTQVQKQDLIFFFMDHLLQFTLEPGIFPVV